MMTRSAGESATDLQRRLRRIDRVDLELGVQTKLLDKRVPQVDVIVNDQYSPRLCHWSHFIGCAAARLV